MNVRRTSVAFDSGGVRCAGYLYRPERNTDLPCVVMAHGFAGTMEFLFHRAQHFAEAGVASLVFDYRGFGASDGLPRQVLDIPAQLDDWRAAIGHARANPGLDPARIALWGSSLSGGHVVTIAAEDPAIAAVIAQVPWFGDGRPASRKLRHMTRWNSMRLTVAAVRDAHRARRGKPPLLMPVVGPPGSGAMFTDPAAARALDTSGLSDARWRNEFAPRIAFSLARYAPGQRAGRLTMPLLVCAARNDDEIPTDFLRAALAGTAQSELRTYPGNHFAIYYSPALEQAMADQTAFLLRHLGH